MLIGNINGVSSAWGAASEDAGKTQSAVKNIGLSGEDAANRTRAAAQGLGEGFQGILSVAERTKQKVDEIPERKRIILEVDDTNVKNYRPPTLSGRVIYNGQAGSRQLI